MTSQSFSLQPFPAASPAPDLKITGTIARQINRLSLRYRLTGDLATVAIAAPTTYPQRQDYLWEATCFEFFLGVRDAETYWEFNLSPAGHWNVYRFAGYRRDMQVETALRALPFQVQVRDGTLTLTLDLDLSPLVLSNQALEVSLTAVMQTLEGTISYWALTHCGLEADFHQRASFVMELNDLTTGGATSK